MISDFETQLNELLGRDRISMIAANECIGNLGDKAKIVFHIIPE